MKVFLIRALATLGTVAGFGSVPDDPTLGENSLINPCNTENVKQQIWTDLADVDCFVNGTSLANPDVAVQSAANVTVGAVGHLSAELDPIYGQFTSTCTEEFGCMCPVNVHWHVGAEHFNVGTYDLNGTEWLAEYGSDGQAAAWLALGIEPGHFCPGYDINDPTYTTQYDWEYCIDMNVGYTYEIHWPHSNLGMCGTEWQFQSHFMDGILCLANQMALETATAIDNIFVDESAKFGVQSQVFTVVNDDAFDYPEWNMLYDGFNKNLATNVAFYQGSTTGQLNGNEVCRGTGGAVAWQVDRGCHKVSAKAFDQMCKSMLEQSDDMTHDLEPHNARVTSLAALVTDVPIGEGLDFSVRKSRN